MPLVLPTHAKVKYVDRLPVKQLRQHYPELKDLKLVTVDIVDDGEKLTKVKNNSQDFIIANHFFEHCQDPIGTLITFFSKLRDDGILYMAIPDKRYTFDMYRKITPYGHLVEEHQVYPAKKFLVEHCREVVKFTEGIKDKKKIEEHVRSLIDSDYSIHQHVWTQKELVDFFNKTGKKFSLNIEIESMANNVHEVICVIRKRSQRNELEKIKAIEKSYFG
jgi:predicted SAM-dependent methyltransferase